MHTCEYTFSTIKQVNVKSEIEWQAEHCTIVSDLLPITLVGLLIKERVSEKPQSQASH